jgi:hypothetical protein
MDKFRLASPAERAIGTPVLARSDRAADRANQLMAAQIWERSFKRCRDQLQFSQYAARPFTKIAESDQPFAVFARGNLRLIYPTTREQLCRMIKTAKGHAGTLRAATPTTKAPLQPPSHRGYLTICIQPRNLSDDRGESTCTVAVNPAANRTPSGTLSM